MSLNPKSFGRFGIKQIIPIFACEIVYKKVRVLAEIQVLGSEK